MRPFSTSNTCPDDRGTTGTVSYDLEWRKIMKVHEPLRRAGFGVSPNETIKDAATTMERAGVGALAVVDGQHLVGIVTDRDLVRRGLALGALPDARVDSVMSSPVTTIEADADLHDCFAIFRTHGLRRLAVVRDGRFIGMITVDDLLMDLAGDLADLARPVTAEVLFSHHDSPLPALL